MYLFDCQRQLLGRRIVGLADLEYGMAHAVQPLIEKPVHRLSGGFLDRDAKLFGLNRLIGVLVQVMIDGAPPVVFAEISTQHVKHCAAARIGVSVKNRVRIGVVLGHNRSPIALIPRAVILILISPNVEIEEVIVA